jgi:hypothetical protein
MNGHSGVGVNPLKKLQKNRDFLSGFNYFYLTR